MKAPLKILLLEDERTDAELIQRLLLKEKVKHEFHLAMNKKDFLKALDEFSPEVIISDNSLPQFNASEALQIVRRRDLQIPFILVTGTVSEDYAAGIIKQGADDYILKDRMTRLPAAISAALNKRKAMKEIADYKYGLDQSAIVAITDQKGTIIYANENFCKISKYSVEELIGEDHRIINSAYHPASYIKDLWVTIANGNIWRGEFRNKAKDGTFYWVDTTIVPFLNADGKPYQYLSIRTDITEKKKAEQELSITLERLSFHIYNAPLGFIEWDARLQVRYWSERAVGIFGWTQDEFISLQKNGYSQVYEEDLPWVSKIAEQLLNGRIERNSIQHRNYTKDGRVIWCEWFNSVLKDKDGKVITILSLVQDITEKKKADVALQRSEQRLNEAQSIAHISNWEIDFVQNKHTWSDEFYRIYGLTIGEVEPSPEKFLSFMHPDDADFTRKKIQETFELLEDSSFYFRFIRKDGVIRHGFSEWRFELDEKGKPARLYGIVQDITDRIKAEEELKKSNERFQFATQATSDIIWELNFETNQYLIYTGKQNLFETSTIQDWRMSVDGKYAVDEDKEGLRQSFRKARIDRTRLLWEHEYRVITEDGSIMHIINHAIFVRDKNGNALKVIGAITDITDRNKLEARLIEQQRLEQVNLMAASVAAQEKERNSIGAELHDNVNQILVGTSMMLSIIRDDPGKLKEYIDTCISSIREAVEENRKIAHELVSPDLDSISILELIKQINETMLEPAGLKTFIHHENFREDWLNDDQKLAVYRIVQEQYTNIIKYAKANSVHIELATNGDFFHMVIADDGIGMQPDLKTKGIGLTNIKSRLSVFKGTAVIATAPGKGFRLEITIPFNSDI